MNHDDDMPPHGMSPEMWATFSPEVKDAIRALGNTFHEVDFSRFTFPPPPTRDEAADELKHAYASGRKTLSGISDRLGVLAYRKETLSTEEATRIQWQLAEVDSLLLVHTVGMCGALPEECEEDQDSYSDVSPVFSMVRDFDAEHPAPGSYLPADIWDLSPGTEVIIEEPPHKRPSTTRFD